MSACGALNCDGTWHHVAVVRNAKSQEVVRSLPFPIGLDLSPEEEEELLQHADGETAAEELERCPELVPRVEEPQPPAEPEKPVTPAWWSDRERDD